MSINTQRSSSSSGSTTYLSSPHRSNGSSLSPSKLRSNGILPAVGYGTRNPSSRSLESIRQWANRRAFSLGIITVVAILLFGTLYVPFIAVEHIDSTSRRSDDSLVSSKKNVIPDEVIIQPGGEHVVKSPAIDDRVAFDRADQQVEDKKLVVNSDQMVNNNIVAPAGKIDRTPVEPAAVDEKVKVEAEQQQEQQQQKQQQEAAPNDQAGMDANAAGAAAAEKQKKNEIAVDDNQHQVQQDSPADNKAAVPEPTQPPPLDTSSVSGKQEAVKRAFLHAWRPYSEKCYGQDELQPVSGNCNNWLNQAATLIDSISTLAVMGLTEEMTRIRDYIATNFKPEEGNRHISFFETIIRVLGGLLSAYDFTNDKMYLDKAKLLADRLQPAFGTATGMPRSQINLATGQAGDYSWTGGASLLAEIGTIQLEYGYLSHHTGDPKYADQAFHIIELLYHDIDHSTHGLFPIYINPHSGQFTNQQITFGAMGDSYYEYLLKAWLLTGKTNLMFQQMYLYAMEGLFQNLYTQAGENAWLADLQNGQKQHKQDHLACFVPGMLALGIAHNVHGGDENIKRQHMEAAEKLTMTCSKYYTTTPTGLSGEYMRFNPSNGGMDYGEPSYKLRPEVLESIFIMWRLTGETKYRELGWQIFEAIEKSARVGGGYSGLKDVRQPGSYDDRMESFFFAETLKYLYLLFSDDTLVPLTGEVGRYMVFNTECHPLTSFPQQFNNSIYTRILVQPPAPPTQLAAIQKELARAEQHHISPHDNAAAAQPEIKQVIEAAQQVANNAKVVVANVVTAAASAGQAALDKLRNVNGGRGLAEPVGQLDQSAVRGGQQAVPNQ